MAFTYDPTTPRGKVRALIGDTDTTDSTKQIFTDAEIDAFLELESQSVRRAAAAACEAVAASAARSAVRYKAEKIFEIDRKDIPKHFLGIAKMHRETESADDYEEIDSLDYELGRYGGQVGDFVGDPFSDL